MLSVVETAVNAEIQYYSGLQLDDWLDRSVQFVASFAAYRVQEK